MEARRRVVGGGRGAPRGSSDVSGPPTGVQFGQQRRAGEADGDIVFIMMSLDQAKVTLLIMNGT